MDRSASRTQWPHPTQNTYEEECDTVVTLKEDKTKAQQVQMDNVHPEVQSEQTNNNLPIRSRAKTNMKLLRRSHAIKETTSPPPDISMSPINVPVPIDPILTDIPVTHMVNNNNTCVVNSNLNTKLNSKKEFLNHSVDVNSPSTMSKGNSSEQQCTDSSGADIEKFIMDTINKNVKDRMFLMRIENELVTLARDSKKMSYKFGPMSSYQRLLVHRAAHYFGMEHNVDSSGQMVVVQKGKKSRLPEHKFSDFLRNDLTLSEEPRKSILKRDSASFEETISYKEDQCSQEEEDLHWPSHVNDGPIWPSSESLDSSKLHPNMHRHHRLTKVESYEGKDTLRANSLRSAVLNKSFSFGGYDQNGPNTRVLTKQDSGSSMSSRLSPSSSGYKSQSQRSDATMSATPSPTATPRLPTQNGVISPELEQTVIWAVTNMASVPVGSVLINPQTGQPYTNEDGSVYHYDPNTPPRMDCNGEGRQSFRNDNNVDPAPVSQCRNSPDNCTSTIDDPLPPDEISPLQPPLTDSASYASDTDADVQPLSTPNSASYHPIPPHPLPTMAPPIEPQVNVGPNMFSNTSIMQTTTPNLYGGLQSVQALNTDPGYSVSSASQSITYLPNYNTHYSTINTGYDRIPVEDNASQEMCGYLMGLNVGEMGRTEATHRPIFYCPSVPNHSTTHPSGHFSQGSTSGMPLYLTPPAQSQGHAQLARYPCGFAHYPPDRSGADCGYAPQPTHTYFPRCNFNSHVEGAASYCSNSTPGNLMGVMQLQPHASLPQNQAARPFRRMPTPPNTPQYGCPQYATHNNGHAAMSTCYPHYQVTSHPSQYTIPSLLRPSLQLGLSNSPPLRAIRGQGYTTARPSGILDSGLSDCQPQTPSHLRFTGAHPQGPMPMYRLNYPSNDLILLNSSRSSFPPPGNNGRFPPSSGRRQRRM